MARRHAHCDAELAQPRSCCARGGRRAASLAAGALPVAPRGCSPRRPAPPTADDATLQAFADTIIPGRKATHDRPRQRRSTRRRSPASTRCPARSRPTRCALYHHPLIGFDALEPAFLADLAARSLPQGGDFLSLAFDERVAVCIGGPGLRQPVAAALGGRGRRAVHRVLRRGDRASQTAAKASGYRVMGLPGAAPNGYRASPTGRKLARERTQARDRWPDGRARRRPDRGHAASAARSPPTGWPSSTTPPAPTRARSWCSSAASASGTRTSSSRWTSSNLSRVYDLDPGPGHAGRHRQRRRRRLEPLPRGVAARADRDLRAARPPPRRRAGPADVAGGDLARDARPATTRASSAGCASAGRRWKQVSKSGGLWAATLHAAGHTCDRVPLAIRPEALRQREVVPHRLHLRRQELADHQLPRGRRAARRAGPPAASRSSRCASPRRGRTATSSRSTRWTRTRAAAGEQRDRVQGADPRHRRDGRRADPHALAQRPAVAVAPGRPAPRLQRRPRRGDRVRPEAGPRACSACRATTQFYKGKPITTMTYDFWVGPARPPLRRHALHAAGDLPVVADQLPLRRRARARRRAVVVGPAEEAGDRALGQPHRAAGDGRGHQRRDVLRLAAAGDASSPTAGRSRVGAFTYTHVRAVARACARRPTRRCGGSLERKGLGRFMKLTETQGAYCAHPLGGCRMAESADLGVVDAHGAGVRLRGPATASARRSSRPRWASTRR